ncbi:MAG: glycerophosphodiester phosphodiesterase [Promethearchaeota archaeon]
MKNFQIVAHRGAPIKAPENTMPAFQHAIELGADAIEFDVRLTSDRIPVIYHFFYLEELTHATGSIFNFTYDQLQKIQFQKKNDYTTDRCKILTLDEVLDTIGDQIGLEIEIKGPEPESSEIIGKVLDRFKHIWKHIEITSYEPILLNTIRKQCPGITTNLLFPRSESWMKPDVIAYLAVQRSRLAKAEAIHLHPTQLSIAVLSKILKHGIQVHAWDVNDEYSLKKIVELNIPRICTDNLIQALNFRKGL